MINDEIAYCPLPVLEIRRCVQIEVTDHSSPWSAYFQLIKYQGKLMTMQNCDDLPLLDSGLNDRLGLSA